MKLKDKSSLYYSEKPNPKGIWSIIAIVVFILINFIAYCVSPVHPYNVNEKKYEFVRDLNKIFTSCDKYQDIIINELSKYEHSPFDPYLICSIIFVESSFNSKAESKFKALGLMQITPLVVKDYVTFNKEIVNIEDRGRNDVNIKLGIWYLHHLYKKWWGNNYHATLSSYWMGINKVRSRKINKTSYSKRVELVYSYLVNYKREPKVLNVYFNNLIRSYSRCLLPFINNEL